MLVQKMRSLPPPRFLTPKVHKIIYTVFFTNTAVYMILVCLEEWLIFLTGPSLLSRLQRGPLSPYWGGRGCSDMVPLAELLFPLGNLCRVSQSCATDSEEEASTCRCLWVIILGLKALYESQDGDKKTVIFYGSLSVSGSQMYPFFYKCIFCDDNEGNFHGSLWYYSCVRQNFGPN